MYHNHEIEIETEEEPIYQSIQTAIHTTNITANQSITIYESANMHTTNHMTNGPYDQDKLIY